MEQFDEGMEGVTTVVLDRSNQIQSVGVANVTLDDDNYNDAGDILLQVRSVVFILLAIFLTICLLQAIIPPGDQEDTNHSKSAQLS